jgi:hypothetical protein
MPHTEHRGALLGLPGDLQASVGCSTVDKPLSVCPRHSGHRHVTSVRPATVTRPEWRAISAESAFAVGQRVRARCTRGDRRYHKP